MVVTFKVQVFTWRVVTRDVIDNKIHVPFGLVPTTNPSESRVTLASAAVAADCMIDIGNVAFVCRSIVRRSAKGSAQLIKWMFESAPNPKVVELDIAAGN